MKSYLYLECIAMHFTTVLNINHLDLETQDNIPTHVFTNPFLDSYTSPQTIYTLKNLSRVL